MDKTTSSRPCPFCGRDFASLGKHLRHCPDRHGREYDHLLFTQDPLQEVHQEAEGNLHQMWWQIQPLGYSLANQVHPVRVSLPRCPRSKLPTHLQANSLLQSLSQNYQTTEPISEPPTTEPISELPTTKIHLRTTSYRTYFRTTSS